MRIPGMEPKETEIPGITEDMIPALVAGAKMAHERTPLDQWLDEVFAEPGDVPASKPKPGEE
jgi:hypothetical protein